MTDPERLRSELARLRLTRDGLAEALDVDRRTVYRWLAGTSPVPMAVWLSMPALRRRKPPPATLPPP